MKYRWEIKETPPNQAVQDLARQSHLDPVLAGVLYQRGYTSSPAIDAFLAPDLGPGHDPFLLMDMDAAVMRLRQAVESGGHIRIHGDYDVDGVTAAALLVRAFRQLNAQVDAYIPHRTQEGYGLSQQAVERASEDGVDVLVTVDCGITALAEARRAKEIGLDLIVTDHHTPLPELPDAVAVINPMRADCDYPFADLSGVGVAYKLACALNPPALGPSLMDLLDLVALGTTADVVPLRGENRVFVKYGLCQLGRTRWAGLGALIDRVGLRRESLTATQAVFHIAPRINAAGRMTDANGALQLLLTDDDFQAADLARQLDEQNDQRRKADETTLKRALEQIQRQGGVEDRRALVLCSSDWHPGVIGIVASRLVERYHLPTVLVAFDGDVGKGSGRSIDGFDLYNALASCTDHLESFGGHRHAAGLTLLHDNIESFSDAFEEVARNVLSREELVPVLEVDYEVRLADLTSDLLNGLKRMEPFGSKNRRPTFIARGVSVEGNARRVGSDRSHLRFAVGRKPKPALDVIGFRLGERAAELAGGRVDLVFAFEENEFRGIRRPQLRLKDFRPSSA
jgi:single-stranded-DNA-specific exonuclease